MSELRLLIVDDEPGIREGMRRSLHEYELIVEEVEETFCLTLDTAASGEEALEKLALSPCDLILLDNKLPGIQGLDLLMRLQEEFPETVVVMVTAYASIEAAVSATKRGAFDFIAKPFTPKELRETVDKAIRHFVLKRHAQKLTQEKRRARFDLISVVSHELKAPLSALEGTLYLLEEPERLDAKAYAHSVERSLRRVEEMRKLIDDLLDLTRIESGQRKRKIERVDLCKVLVASVDTIREESTRRKILLRIRCCEDTSLVEADPGEMEIVFNNLLGNAVKYNRDEGEIDIDIDLSDGLLLLRVSDTGIGMTKEEMAGLFKEFSRIRNEKTRDIRGSGLGLAIVKKIVGLYGGNIEVQSEPDAGTVFTVRMPMTRCEKECADAEAGNPDVSAGR